MPPSLYKQAARMLGQAGLGREHTDALGRSRLVVEKPFGRDLQTAVELDRGIHQYLKEHRIFKIDHYLAKETVQNILMFRFANGIFEPVWNRRYIDHVSIIAAEAFGIEDRAEYYEQAGCLRDKFQNHMVQFLIEDGLTNLRDAIHWCDVIVATGSTISNGTLPDLLSGKPVVFFGVTIAGPARIMNLHRFCPCSR